MMEATLELLYQELALELFPRKKLTIKVQFNNSKNLRHTIQMKHKTVLIRLSHLIVQAPENVLQALGQILLFKLFRFKSNPALRKIYNNYIEEYIVPGLPEIKHRISPQYTPVGTYFNLMEIFQRLNQDYFKDQLDEPQLGWSLKPSYARLGFYDASRNLLVISQIFDSRKTEPSALDFLVYHEMLHIYFPTESINGRRRIHPREFRRKEQEFPGYDKIQRWIHKKRFRL